MFWVAGISHGLGNLHRSISGADLERILAPGLRRGRLPPDTGVTMRP